MNVIDYPNSKGGMAHQLNYATERIKKDCFIAIYNADSKPHKDTFDYVSNVIEAENADVFQQPAFS